MYPPYYQSKGFPLSYTRNPDAVSPKTYSTDCAFKYIPFPKWTLSSKKVSEQALATNL